VYLAKTPLHSQSRYILRESFQKDGIRRCRDLFDLGADPSAYIIYPGGNAYYIDEIIETRLEKLCIKFQEDELDDIFWPFVKPVIRRALESFRHRGKNDRKRPVLGASEKKKIHLRTHVFDKRRVHFLRSGRTDQRGLGRMPATLLRWLQNRSRDEIEQRFIQMERVLRPDELKTYVYVIFNLERFFSTILAERAPEMLDPEEMDAYFIEEICRLNQSSGFWGDLNHGAWLHEYLTRYVTIYFDFEFSYGLYLQDELRAFINRHRAYSPPAKRSNIDMSEISALFGIGKNALEKMSLAALTRRYRRLALKHHPDRGGDSETFIRITEAYREMVRMKRKG